MNLLLKRTHKGEGYTEGILYRYDGELNRFIELCDTLEPQWRDLNNGALKVVGQTAIPEGLYQVSISFSPRWNRMMPYVRDVRDFSGVMIHTGNTSADTKGCILVGRRVCADMIRDSRTWFSRLYADIMQACERGEKNTLTVI